MADNEIIYDLSYSRLVHVPALTTFTVIESVTQIIGCSKNEYAFKDAASTLTSLNINSNSNLYSIAQYSFYHCEKLESVDLTNAKRLNSIGKSAFEGCTSLLTIKIPSSICTLESECFKDCSSVTSIVFEQGQTILDSIGSKAFEGCSSLTSITIPNIYWVDFFDIFNLCTSLENIYVRGTSGSLSSKEGVLFYINRIFTMPAARTGKYTIPKGTDALKSYAFKDSKITSITFADESLINIESYCFYNSSINEIILPASVKMIQNYAFSHCAKLTSITLNSGLEEIGAFCFESCVFASISIPNSLKELGGCAFKDCKAQIDYLGTPFLKENNNFLISNDEKSVYQYSGTDKTITIPETVTSIKEFAFANSDIETVTLTNVEVIKDFAFYNCKALTTINFPSSIEVIGNSAFENCVKLDVDLNFETQTLNLGERAFFNCQKIKSISFLDESKIDSISPECFQNCISINSIKLPKQIKKISYRAFKGCSSLNEIEIPKCIPLYDEAFQESGLTKIVFGSDSHRMMLSPVLDFVISNYCFYKCRNLSIVDLGSNDDLTIGIRAFSFTNLTTIHFTSTYVGINLYCFQGCELLERVIFESCDQCEGVGFGAFFECPSLREFSIIEQKIGQTPFIMLKIEQSALYGGLIDPFIAFPPKSPLKCFSFSQLDWKIKPKALFGCKNLVTVFIPKGTVEISSSAFEGCTSLKFINIPSSVTKVSEKAFSGCNKLSCSLNIDNINIPGFKTMLQKAGMPQRCFSECSLQTCRYNFKLMPNILMYIIISIASS